MAVLNSHSLDMDTGRAWRHASIPGRGEDGSQSSPVNAFDVKGDASGLAFSVPQEALLLESRVQLPAHLSDWEQAAHSMRVSAFGNNKLCYKPFHLLKTCASRVGSLSEHVLTKKPTVLTSPSNVNRTK